jgi:hypothetical protein
MQLVASVGSKDNIRIRMRGIGSGYPEGPMQQELQEPLHFNVSAENEALLQAAVIKVRELIDRSRAELTGR